MPQMKTDSNLKMATIELYRLVLVFQAEALRHLTRLAIGRVWSDTLDPTQWSDMVKKITAQEDVCDKIITRDSHQYIINNGRCIDGLRSEVEGSFKKQLEVLQVKATVEEPSATCGMDDRGKLANPNLIRAWKSW